MSTKDPLSVNSRSLRVRFCLAFTLMSILPFLIFIHQLLSLEVLADIPFYWFIVALLFSFLGFFLMAGILDPISKVVRGVKNMSNGEHFSRFEQDRSDEIGEIGSALNEMGKGLRLSVENLRIHEQKAEKLHDEINQLLSKIEALSITDDLTGLYNKKYFIEKLNTEVKKAVDEQFPCSLLLFYINNFRSYNEVCGEAAGDILLQEAAKSIMDITGAAGKISRLGGARFVIILPGKNRKDALILSAKIKEGIRKNLSQTKEKPKDKLTVSAGLASIPVDGTTNDQLLKKAVANLAGEDAG